MSGRSGIDQGSKSKTAARDAPSSRSDRTYDYAFQLAARVKDRSLVFETLEGACAPGAGAGAARRPLNSTQASRTLNSN